MDQTITADQALVVIDKIVAAYQGTRQDHVVIQQIMQLFKQNADDAKEYTLLKEKLSSVEVGEYGTIYNGTTDFSGI
jgi:hypothetical protein